MQLETPAGYPTVPLPPVADYATHLGTWAAMWNVSPTTAAFMATVAGLDRTVHRLQTGEQAREDYLRRLSATRGPGPPIAFSATAVVTDEPQSPPAHASDVPFALERAARLARAADDFRLDYLAGRLAPDHHQGVPVDMSQFRNLFGASFGYEGRALRLFSSAAPLAYAVVLYRGQFWRLALAAANDAPVPAEVILRRLRVIVAQTKPLGEEWGAFGPAQLSALEPQEAAAGLEALMAGSPSRDTLSAVLGAQLVLCLDLDAVPISASECGRIVQSGNPGNRWYLSATNIVVCGNGKAGFLFNFSVGIEGNVMVRFAAESARRAEQRVADPGGTNRETEDGAGNMPEQLPWGEPRPSSRIWLARAPQRLSSLSSYRRTEAGAYRLPIGRRQLDSAGLAPVDAFVIALIAALGQQAGRVPPVFQMISRSTYRYGPLAYANLTTPEALEFCERLKDGSVGAAAARRDAWTLYLRAEHCAKEKVRAARASLIIDPTASISLRGWRRHAWKGLFWLTRSLPRPGRVRGVSPERASVCESLTISHPAIDERIAFFGRPGSRAGHPAACWLHYQIRETTTDVVLAPGTMCQIEEAQLVDHIRLALERTVELGRHVPSR